MDKKNFLQLIDFWQKSVDAENLLPRLLVDSVDMKSKEVVDITGPRRSGKSSVLKLLIKKLKSREEIMYINFEDPLFIAFNTHDVIDDLIDIYKEYYSDKLQYLFFDEIHSIHNWEKAIRKLRDGSAYKIFISGSSSKLLGGELSSQLTGRHLSYKLYPLSFREYLDFKDVTLNTKKEIILEQTKLLRLFDDYILTGGFPEIVLTRKPELVKQYFFDMLHKDIVRKYDIRSKEVLEKMALFIFSNSAKIISISSLSKMFGISYEITSVYLNYFKEALMIFELPQFSYSLRTQMKALKKYYAVDTGMVNAVSFRFSENKGRMLENIVCIHLLRNGYEFYYYKTKNNKEVDFCIKKQGNKFELIQVCATMEEFNTKQREINSLLEAMEEMGIKQGLILTYSRRESLKFNKWKIEVLPIYEWLLTN
jgi:hypothetical protein